MKFIVALIFLAATLGRAQDSEPVYPPNQSREMTVVLFNQKDLSGWTYFPKDSTNSSPTWSVTNGVIHCTGQPNGFIRTTGVYSNYFLTVEWRFVKIAPNADNSGILVHLQPGDKIWPQCVQVQGKHTRQGDIFLMEGAEAKEHKGMDKNTPVPFRGESMERPVGEWNKAEIICKNNKVTAFINGKLLNEVTECTLNSGHIGIQSEGGELEIRSIAYSPL